MLWIAFNTWQIFALGNSKYALFYLPAVTLKLLSAHRTRKKKSSSQSVCSPCCQPLLKFLCKYNAESLHPIFKLMIFSHRINSMWPTCPSGNQCCTPQLSCTPLFKNDASLGLLGGTSRMNSTPLIWRHLCSLFRIILMTSIQRRWVVFVTYHYREFM